MDEIVLQPADIFLTKGDSLFSRLIRFCSRSCGESRAKVNHAGVVVKEGTLRTAEIVESVAVARHCLLWEHYGPPAKDRVAIFRPKNLTAEQVDAIVASAKRQVGKKYGIAKVAAHFLDWLLLGAYVFRRLANNGDYPICSWLVAHSFAEADKNFGVDPGAAEPDDIWDFVIGNKDKYELVHPLERLQAAAAKPAKARIAAGTA
jgi:hypothetical protein